MPYKNLFLVVLCLFGWSASAQQNIDEMIEQGRKTLMEPAYEDRKAALSIFKKQLKDFISTEEGFQHSLKDVGNVMRLSLGDEAAIYTWQVPDSTFQYRRYGLVAALRKGEVVITELEEQHNPMATFQQLKAENWYGAIYYEAIPVEKGRKAYYTLLGFAKGKRINEKIIDVVEVDRRGRPRFGAKIFRVQEWQDQSFQRAPMRLILKYGGDISASVKWNEEEEMIVMDHLSPPDEKLKGVYQEYGPDMSYDGLEWEDDWWHLREEVRFETGQEIPIVPPDKPTDLPPAKGGN